ncbi:TatD family nuclease-associated radical SAM protein [bacterium]|nr:TatD family nuclease-associated radical SAM protein [bacterium]
MKEQNLVYFLDGKLYVNLTNACTNQCLFCIRNLKDDVKGKSLWLSDEKFSADDVIAQFNEIYNGEKDLIFCGYGEPTLKLDILKTVANYVKKNHPEIKIRLNTNGHANVVYKRNILPELKGLVDDISVSLNAQNEDLYKEISQPNIKTETPLKEVEDFIKKSVDAGFDTTASVVTGYKNYDVDVEKCETIAHNLGAKFRNREWLDNGY